MSLELKPLGYIDLECWSYTDDSEVSMFCNQLDWQLSNFVFDLNDNLALISEYTESLELPSGGSSDPPLSLPSGAGVELGMALLTVSALAFGVRFVARLILNR